MSRQKSGFGSGKGDLGLVRFMETMAPKPLKRLTVVCSARNTPLKQGVNEILSRRMQRLLSSCLIQFIPLLVLAVLPVHGAETNRLVITHVTVIDGTGSG